VISALDKSKVLNILLGWERVGHFAAKNFEDLCRAVRAIPENEVSECLSELIRDGYLGRQFKLPGWKRPKPKVTKTKVFRGRQIGLFEEEETATAEGAPRSSNHPNR
jgi:hypothetical protein